MRPTLRRCAAALTLGLATLLLAACGPDEELVLAEGQTLDGLRYCAYGCFVDTFCAELFLKDTGRSPALCVPIDICDRFTCANGGQCRIFETFPAEVRCVQ